MHSVKGVQLVILWQMISSLSISFLCISFLCSIARQVWAWVQIQQLYVHACMLQNVLLVMVVGHAGQQHIPLLQILVKLYGGVNAACILAVHMLLVVSLSNLYGETTM